MRLLSVRNILFFAVITGLVAGLGLAFTQNRTTTTASSSITTGTTDSDLDAAHLLEMHGEEALIESGLGGLETLHNGFSTAPEFLRSELEKRNIIAPEGATTTELQDLMAASGIAMQDLHQ